jgi:hypothetical protein
VCVCVLSPAKATKAKDVTPAYCFELTLLALAFIRPVYTTHVTSACASACPAWCLHSDKLKSILFNTFQSHFLNILSIQVHSLYIINRPTHSTLTNTPGGEWGQLVDSERPDD